MEPSSAQNAPYDEEFTFPVSSFAACSGATSWSGIDVISRYVGRDLSCLVPRLGITDEGPATNETAM